MSFSDSEDLTCYSPPSSRFLRVRKLEKKLFPLRLSLSLNEGAPTGPSQGAPTGPSQDVSIFLQDGHIHPRVSSTSKAVDAVGTDSLLFRRKAPQKVSDVLADGGLWALCPVTT